MWGSKIPRGKLTDEELDCLRDWDNYSTLGKLPHELGYADECYHEDVEAIKTMKKWMEQRAAREDKKEQMKRRTLEKMRASSSSRR